MPIYLNTTFTFGKKTNDNFINRNFQCPYSFIFVPILPLGKVAETTVLGGPEIPHYQQQYQKIPLSPHQDGTKQGRRYNHATGAFDEHSAAFPWL